MNQPTSEPNPSNSLPKSIARVARIVLLAYLFFCLLLMVMESRLIYMPPPPRDFHHEAQQLGGEEVWFRSEDQTKLHGWFFPKRDSSRALVYFHGTEKMRTRMFNWDPNSGRA